MRAKFSFTFLILFFLMKGFSQSKTDTLRLFFAISQTQSQDNFKKLDSLQSALKGKNCLFKIYGYADFLNSNDFNLSLSQKRADAVKNYLLKGKWLPEIKIAECKGFGEKFSKEIIAQKGEAFQRRVDIIVEQKISPALAKESVPLKVKETKPVKVLKQELPVTRKKNIEELEKGESLALEGLSFEPGRHYLLKESRPVLDALLETLKSQANLKIEIQGHICCTAGDGDGFDYDTQDKKLSENRAKVVHTFLIKNGIDPSRLTYKGYGHSQPKILKEMSPEDEQVNRRVEIKIIEN